MGVLELACRWGRKQGGRGAIRTPLPLVPIFLFFLVRFLSKEGGKAYFNMLLDGYRALFRNCRKTHSAGPIAILSVILQYGRSCCSHPTR